MSSSESKKAKFQRLAESRGNRLIREIYLLSNLSNKKNYDYSPQDVKALFEPIDQAINEAKAMFEGNAGKVKFSE